MRRGVKDYAKRAANLYGLRTDVLRKWVRSRAAIKAAAEERDNSRRESSFSGTIVFPAEEQLLLAGFRARRRTGMPVRGAWLQFEMRRLVRSALDEQDDGNSDAEIDEIVRCLDFKASKGWLRGFLQRHRLVSRRATRKKNKALDLDAIRRYHALLRRRLKRHGATGVWGRWSPKVSCVYVAWVGWLLFLMFIVFFYL